MLPPLVDDNFEHSPDYPACDLKSGASLLALCRRLGILSLAFLTQQGAIAQIEIKGSELVPLSSGGYVTTLWAIDSPDFPLLQSIFAQKGENQVFDFTGLAVLGPTVTATAVFPSSAATPWAEDEEFIGANRVTFEQTGDAESWGFWTSDPDAYAGLGRIIVHDVNEDGILDTTKIWNDPPDQNLPLPLRYGSSWAETFTQRAIASGTVTESRHDHDAVVDAWGRLDTPVGSAPVLRVRETRLTTRDLGGNTVQSQFTLVTFYSRVGLSAMILANESDEVVAGAYSTAEADGTGVVEVDRSTVALHPLYPNPFTDAVTIPFEVELPGAVQIRVYDVTGRQVETVVDEHVPPGTNTAEWRPAQLAPGVYVVQFRTERARLERVAVLLPR